MASSGFSRLPDWFTREAVQAFGLNAYDIAAYVVLTNRANRAGEGWSSHDRMAREGGMSVRRVPKSLAALEACGLVAIVSRKEGRSNRYRVAAECPQLSNEPLHHVQTKDARA